MKYKNGIIAFCGSKFSGKSTSANIFKELIDAPTEEIAIAGHLKEACARVFNIDINAFLDPTRKEVEFEDYIVLETKDLQAIFREFDVKNIDFDKTIRPHIGRVIHTPRELLQYIGTELLHPVDPLIHVKKALVKKDPNKLTLITDLRFAAEFEYFVNGNTPFTPVYVKNTTAEARAEVDAHASERQYKLFVNQCRLIDNDIQEIRNLRTKIAALIGDLYG